MISLACGKPPSYNPVEPQGPPQAKVRVANFYLSPNSTPGAPLDFYDTGNPSSSDKPLISGLAYGQISPYVAPRAGGNPKYVTSNNWGDLYLFSHGCRFPSGNVDGGRNGEPIKEAGWLKGQQETVVIANGTSGPASGQATQYIMEVEPTRTDGYSQVLKPPAGKGMLILDSFGLVSGTAKIGSIAVRVDGACTSKELIPGQNGQSNNGFLGAGVADNLPLSPGSHTLEVIATPSPGLGFTPATCKSAPTLGAKTVKIRVGSPTMVFLYGPDPQRVKFLVTKIG